MAVSDKNIVITPNISGILDNQPKIVFTGADSSTGDSAAITLTARPENSGTLNFSASEGQLFSISNNLTNGDIFTVNDVSGIPSLSINANGIINIAEYGGRVLVGTDSDDSSSLLQIAGNVRATAYYGDGSNLTGISTGTPSTITVSANNSTNETVYLTFVDGATGSQGIETDTGLTYNPSTGLITATAFSGDGSALTGISAGVSDGIFLEYNKIVSSNYNVNNGVTALTACNDSDGISIASGVTVTISDSSGWVITGGDKNMGLDAMVATSNQTERTIRTGTIKPTLDSSYDLGDSAVVYRHIYGGNITASGRVGVGTTSPVHPLTVTASGATSTFSVNPSSNLTVIGTAQSSATNSDLYIDTKGTGSHIFRYNAGGDEIARFTSGGLAIGGTGSANTLDDYEEGIFTPAYTSGVSGSYQTQVGTYTKIGRLVYIEVQIDGNSMTGDANQLKIGGLPFVSQNDNSSNGGLYHVYTGGTYDGGNTTTWLVNRNEAVIYAYNINGATWKGNEMSDLNGGYRIAGFYQTAT
tara:strand:+ start:238 stop:1824 length:1587 start_codon:yes stop_codon:yes gene_type:complete